MVYGYCYCLARSVFVTVVAAPPYNVTYFFTGDSCVVTLPTSFKEVFFFLEESITLFFEEDSAEFGLSIF